jgi:hypothetical protein
LVEAEVYNMVTSFISSVGFPIFVAVWMMTQGKKEKEELRKAIEANTIAVTQLSIFVQSRKE